MRVAGLGTPPCVVVLSQSSLMLWKAWKAELMSQMETMSKLIQSELAMLKRCWK
jgi:hypothetical protein